MYSNLASVTQWKNSPNYSLVLRLSLEP